MSSNFKVDFNLKQTTMIQIAIHCWEQRDVKTEVKNYFLSKYHSQNYINWHEVRQELQYWTYKILYDFRHQVTLPDTAKNELTYVIVSVGGRMIEWLKQITQRLRKLRPRCPILEHYLDNIFWTNCGTIDEVRIFRSLCTNPKITDTPYLYEEACNYCLEELVQTLWKSASREDANVILQRSMWNIGEEYNAHLLLYWHSADRQTHLFAECSLPRNYHGIYDFTESPTANNFRLAVIDGHEIAVKYFYDRLSEDEKSNRLVETAEMLLNEKIRRLRRHLFKDACNKTHIDILVFLIQQMSHSQQNNLLKKYKDDILYVLLTNWPWQHLFLLALEQTWHCFTFHHYKKLIATIIDAIFDEYELHEVKETATLCILVEIWRETPVVFKKGIVEDRRDFSYMFLSVMEDISFPKYVINDADLASKRPDLLDNLVDYCYYLIIQRKYHVVDKIIREILYDDEERGQFKDKIDSSRICQCFILEREYSSADEYLLWRFDTEEERNNFKINSKLDNTCCAIICDIWCHDNFEYFGKWRIERFFEWFMYQESDMNNLKKQLLSSDKFKGALMRFVGIEYVKRFNEFLNCCHFSTAEIDRLRAQAKSMTKPSTTATRARNRFEL